MNERPYLALGVADLERLREEASGDAARLYAIRAELSHRNTDRAARLLAAINADLAGVGTVQGTLPLAGSRPPSDNGAASSSKSARRRPSQESMTGPTSNRSHGMPFPLPPLLDLEADITALPPPTSGSPAATLVAWTALEALDPRTYSRREDLVAGDRRRVVMLDRGVPWPDGKSRPKQRLYYQVPLGTIRMAPAMEALVRTFGAQEEFRPRPGTSRAMIAAVLLDARGIPVEDNPVAVSSFAWALPQAMRGDLASLGAWPRVETRLADRLAQIVRIPDGSGGADDQGQDATPRALELSDFDRLHRWLVQQLDLDAGMVEPPDFAMRVYQPYRVADPPATDLLNSFYLDDLMRARRAWDAESAPTALRRYLGAEAPQGTRDLLNDQVAVAAAVTPVRTPPVRWPAPGGYPLVLLQQAAVNVVRGELAREDGAGIVAVNGPPGTGKTTLLRDVVAACVLDRALAMAAFEDPMDAFEVTGHKITAGQSFLHLYRLHPSLRGHEVLVASSNNKAVENVSRELPGREAMGGDLRYLSTLSDRLRAGAEASGGSDGGSDADDGGVPPPAPPEETWGAISAVLGNSGNRYAFIQGFWWDPERSLHAYLRAVQGKPRLGGERRTGADESPAIAEREGAPAPGEVRANWRRASEHLLALHARVVHRIAEVEALREAMAKLAPARRDLDAALEAHRATEDVLAGARDVAEAARDGERAVIAALAGAQTIVEAHTVRKPGWLARLFRRRAYNAWRDEGTPYLADYKAARGAYRDAERGRRAAETEEAACEQDATRAGALLAERRATFDRLAVRAREGRAVLGDRVVDRAFFDRGHEESQRAAPWLPDTLHAEREAVFAAAMAVHRAFLDAAAQRMQHNLAALMQVLGGGGLGDDARDALIPDLWATLFAVIPVVSTTFASVGRMLRALPAGSIGWLLVDEAGQATPQAAVGALLRARRAVVVGDPLQIPPVTSLPDPLAMRLCAYLGVDAADWAAPAASAQALADRASRHRAMFKGGGADRAVGAPLLVHRRCAEPMFSISNAIAYDGLMVFGTQPRNQGRIEATLGPSCWIDVAGEAEGKWCPAGGRAAMELLDQLATAGVVQPDLFVITPFRDVAAGMRRLVEGLPVAVSAFGADPAAWAADRVGTIHTFQGREAEAVILLLGAPAPAQHGTRAWATGAPNILNVAVSRAKSVLYVVGSRTAWAGMGHARTLASQRRLQERRL